MSKTTRAALKAAAEKIGALKTKIQELETAQDRAQASADHASRNVTIYAGLDREITRWRVDQVKREASTKTLPADLQKKVFARRDAIEELSQSESTLEAIREEIDALNMQLSKAAPEHRKCAVAVLHELGESLARELASINSRRAELRQLISGLSEVKIFPPGKPPESIGLTPATAEAFQMGSSIEFPQGVDPEAELARRWSARLDALCADPDAEITPPKHLTPDDYVPGKPLRFVEPGRPWEPGTPGTWRSEE